MNIQIIRYNGKAREGDPDVTITGLNSPRSLDEFDVNIIDLTNENLWKNSHNVSKSITVINDFRSLKSMVEQTKRSRILYALPKNIMFKCGLERGRSIESYTNCIPLKDNIVALCNDILPQIFPDNIPRVLLSFENTRTTINDTIYEADFHFNGYFTCITKSNRSEKGTTIRLKDRIYATTLDVTQNNLLEFIKIIFCRDQKQAVPEWIDNFTFNDDLEQKRVIDDNKQLIEEANETIRIAEGKLLDNLKYKSILYTNGDELVSVVFDILEKILDCDLSQFIDEKKEDFRIFKNNITLIGEIKGITSNVKSEHISQVEVHYQGYLDSLQETGKEEDVHQILIINPLRAKDINSREPVHETQITLAKRNGCLIIETITLLKMYEKFLKKEITTEKCIEIFSAKTGLLSTEDF